MNHRSLIQMQIELAAKCKWPREKNPFGHHQPPAPFVFDFRDRLRKGVGVPSLAIANAAKIRQLELPLGNLRQSRLHVDHSRRRTLGAPYRRNDTKQRDQTKHDASDSLHNLVPRGERNSAYHYRMAKEAPASSIVERPLASETVNEPAQLRIAKNERTFAISRTRAHVSSAIRRSVLARSLSTSSAGGTARCVARLLHSETTAPCRSTGSPPRRLLP